VVLHVTFESVDEILTVCCHNSNELIILGYLHNAKTKTNRRRDREQYTRSNAATARLLTLVKPAETLPSD